LKKFARSQASFVPRTRQVPSISFLMDVLFYEIKFI
jgi:hypothetical protein